MNKTEINSILLPLDRVERFDSTLTYGLSLARDVKAKLIVHQSYMLPSPGYPPTGSFVGVYPVSMPDPTMQATLREESIEERIKDLPLAKTVAFEVLSDVDLTTKSLEQVINERDVDLLLLSVEKHNKLNELFGSPAGKLVDNVPCTTLVVPDNFAYKAFTRMSLAIDGDNLEDGVDFRELDKVLDAFDLPLQIVNVRTYEEKGQQELLKKLNDRLQQRTPLGVMHTLLADSVEEGILDFIELNGIDLLALIYRKHGFFRELFNPGLQRKLLSHADIPLLILRDE